MMWVLNTIAFDVLHCMFQVFDYYLYAVYKFFGKEMADMSSASLSPRLRNALSRIETNLIVSASASAANNASSMRFEAPRLSEMVDLARLASLHGLAERILGVESM